MQEFCTSSAPVLHQSFAPESKADMRPQDPRPAAAFTRADAEGGSIQALSAAWRLYKRPT